MSFRGLGVGGFICLCSVAYKRSFGIGFMKCIPGWFILESFRLCTLMMHLGL